MQRITALALGLVASVALVGLGAWARGNPRAAVAAEDTSAPLARIAIHYAPASDLQVLGIWRQLFAVLPARVEVEVDVAVAADYARFMAALREGDVPNRGRFRPVIGAPLAAWPRELAPDRAGLYVASLDARTVAVGDIRLGLALLGRTALSLDDSSVQAARFDGVAERLAARGFRVVRVPVLVREGGTGFISYTDALFDREVDGTRTVYLPTYALSALDGAAQKLYESEGFVVHPIDAAALRAGSLGALVDVLARG